MQEELDQLEIKDCQNPAVGRVNSVEQLLSPADENIGIFSRIEGTKVVEDKTDEQAEEAFRVSSFSYVTVLQLIIFAIELDYFGLSFWDSPFRRGRQYENLSRYSVWRFG